jgi:hypothetical protein
LLSGALAQRRQESVTRPEGLLGGDSGEQFADFVQDGNAREEP